MSSSSRNDAVSRFEVRGSRFEARDCRQPPASNLRLQTSSFKPQTTADEGGEMVVSTWMEALAATRASFCRITSRWAGSLA